MPSDRNLDILNDDQPEVTLEKALSLAKGHHKSGNFILAERTYRDILRAIPDEPDATHYLGVLLFQTGSAVEAEKYMARAVVLNDNDPRIINNYAAVLSQNKKHEEALVAFDDALAQDPHYIDALNNKSFTLWKLDRFKEAEDVARSVLRLDGKNVAALSNLGMALARQDKDDDALDVWEQATSISPEDANLWTNWGNTLREMRKVSESEEKCRRAVELAPDNVEAINNLANALRDLGQFDEAIELYNKATDLQPDHYQAHDNKAIALIDMGRYYEAAVSARYAIAFKEDLAGAHSHLSQALCYLGDYKNAHMAAQRALHLNPDSAEAWLDITEVLIHADHWDDAEASLREALKRSPDSARGYLKLAELRDQMNEVDEALEAIDKAIELSPDMPILKLKKTHILNTSNNVPAALALTDEILLDYPTLMTAQQMKAEMLISSNRNDEAEEIVRHVLDTHGHMAHPHLTLTSLKKFKSEDDPDFVAMMDLEKRIENYGKDAEAVLNYAISAAYEQMGDYDKSFEYLQKANEFKLTVLPNTKAKNERQLIAHKKRFTPDVIEQYEGQGFEDDSPIFIVGMPRSGTTLTEQIISSHPEVYGAGELTDIARVMKAIDYNAALDVKALGEMYIQYARARERDGQSRFFTDKMPGNYTNIGLIAMILPNAKIIHCRRNPIDTCLSCYRQNFARGHYWSYNLETLGDEYLAYLDLMEYWRELLPGRFLEINYEDTVNDFENQARKLIDYVGLEWDDACLEPHKQKRAVLTASKAQVTKPIYTSSVEKWRRYEKHLDPLVKRLLPEEAA